MTDDTHRYFRAIQNLMSFPEVIWGSEQREKCRYKFIRCGDYTYYIADSNYILEELEQAFIQFEARRIAKELLKNAKVTFE